MHRSFCYNARRLFASRLLFLPFRAFSENYPGALEAFLSQRFPHVAICLRVFISINLTEFPELVEIRGHGPLTKLLTSHVEVLHPFDRED